MKRTCVTIFSTVSTHGLAALTMLFPLRRISFQACPAVCGPPSCQCPRGRGFVRDASGTCVHRSVFALSTNADGPAPVPVQRRRTRHKRGPLLRIPVRHCCSVNQLFRDMRQLLVPSGRVKGYSRRNGCRGKCARCELSSAPAVIAPRSKSASTVPEAAEPTAPLLAPSFSSSVHG